MCTQKLLYDLLKYFAYQCFRILYTGCHPPPKKKKSSIYENLKKYFVNYLKCELSRKRRIADWPRSNEKWHVGLDLVNSLPLIDIPKQSHTHTLYPKTALTMLIVQLTAVRISLVGVVTWFLFDAHVCHWSMRVAMVMPCRRDRQAEVPVLQFLVLQQRGHDVVAVMELVCGLCVGVRWHLDLVVGKVGSGAQVSMTGLWMRSGKSGEKKNKPISIIMLHASTM